MSFDYNAGSNNSILTQLKNFVVNLTAPVDSTPEQITITGPTPTTAPPGTTLNA